MSVAQLAEHRVVAPVVEGSSPFTHPINPAKDVTLVGGPLAQLVEQLTLNQRVWSSSLQRPTKTFEFVKFSATDSDARTGEVRYRRKDVK